VLATCKEVNTNRALASDKEFAKVGSDDDDDQNDDAIDEADDTSSSSEPAPETKESRMKTNKVIFFSSYSLKIGFAHGFFLQRKATNFYSNRNVKNKNRSKAALMRSLPVGKRR
jgi:hypothetical protein